MPLDLKFSRLINIGLKISEIIIACIYLGVVVSQTTEKVGDETYVRHHLKVTTFVALSSGFVVPTFLLLLVQLHSSSAENQKKSIFEILYNACAVIVLASVSAALLTFSERLISSFPGRGSFRAGGVMGLINTALYGASTVLAFIDYTRSS